MTKIVVGVFEDFTAAKIMAPELINEGFPTEAVSVMAPDTNVEANRYFNSTPATHPEDESDIETGAAIGGLGGLLLGAVALTIPGLGLLYAVGPLATMITGALTGALTGGLVSTLHGMGIAEYQAESYEAGIREGHSHVFVHTDTAHAERAAQLMRDRHALRVDIHDVSESLPSDITRESEVSAV
jgi:uncharacterized membrane protein